ncbi:type VI secretion system protein TssA [Limobrevibacterium gyesilva]|uniref:Type VI secretion system protein TssA n=1 Tax=Limobrevibacterium gyesilva TaxID=2991712 RepID=A0AA42CDI3_9PROT|nr:type VI secretion system protein TssA [Limobrevibacterium gyesilva]MCW3473899.1 type VI secretion system protein TssA [Limobrevibacterium gyesilva]
MQDWPDGFDLDAMLSPIPGDTPVGTDLREDFSAQSPYYRLRDLRAEARALERAIDAGDPNATEAEVAPKWRQIRDLASRVLTETAKDLEVAAWYTEALVRSDGLRGLAAGAALIAGLTETFWDNNLYPVPDEDGIVTRVAPVTGLNGEGGDGTLIQPLRKLPLFPRPDGSVLSYWQYEQSAELEGIGDSTRRQQRLDAGVMAFDDVEKEARAAGAARFGTLRAQAEEASARWRAMGDVLDARAGMDSPPTSRVRDLVDQILAAARRYAPQQEEAPEAAETQPVPGEAAPGDAGVSVAGGSAGRAVTRDDMLRELERIAEYFRRTEPHSPLADTLNEAVRRGRMTWPELLAELVPDVATRHSILTGLGIKPGDE